MENTLAMMGMVIGAGAPGVEAACAAGGNGHDHGKRGWRPATEPDGQAGQWEAVYIDDDGAETAAQRHVLAKDRRQQAELALYESRQELRRMAGLLCTIQEDEKRRIALDLHDGLGQTLTLIKLSMENSLRLAETEASEAVAESLRQAVPRIKDALAEVHRVAMALRPPMLDDLGVLPTLAWYLREYEATCAGLTVDRAINIAERDVPGPLRITLFRIVQEATGNIVKHAGATWMRISLNRCDDILHMTIEDNGCGFEPAKVGCSSTTGRGLGLLSLKERTSQSGGIHQLDSAPGLGTRHQFWWPCEQAA